MNDDSTDINLINLESIDEKRIKKILDEYLIENRIDPDGDVLITKAVRIYIRTDRRIKVLRLFNFTRLKDDIDESETIKSISEINTASSVLKYSKVNNSIMTEYGFLLSGYIDKKILIKTIQHMEEEILHIKRLFSAQLEG